MDRVALCIFCTLNAAPMDVVTIKILCIHAYTICINSLKSVVQFDEIFILLPVHQCYDCRLLPAEGDKPKASVTVTSLYKVPVTCT